MRSLALLLLLTLAAVHAAHALPHPSSPSSSSRDQSQDDGDASSSQKLTTSPVAAYRDWILPVAVGAVGIIGYTIGDIRGEQRGIRKGYQLGWRDVQDLQCVHQCVEERRESWRQVHESPQERFKSVFDADKAQAECLDRCNVAPDSIIRRMPVAVREEFFRQDDGESKTVSENDVSGTGGVKTPGEADKASDGTSTHHFSLPERIKGRVGNVLRVLGHAGRNGVVMPPLGLKTPLRINIVP